MSGSGTNAFASGSTPEGLSSMPLNSTKRITTMKLAKSPTTPSDPTRGFLNAVQKLGTPLDETYLILHGTTLGVNAIIQHKGVNTGIITNKGFRDIFEIGRGDVPPEEMYDFNYQKPPSLVKRRNIIGVDCRVDANGEILTDLDENALKTSLQNLMEHQQRGIHRDLISPLLQESDSRAENGRTAFQILSAVCLSPPPPMLSANTESTKEPPRPYSTHTSSRWSQNTCESSQSPSPRKDSAGCCSSCDRTAE